VRCPDFPDRDPIRSSLERNGIALLYAIAAAVLFLAAQPQEDARAAAEARFAGQLSRAAWLALWLGAAFFTALPQMG
jgi:hypothetical protein